MELLTADEVAKLLKCSRWFCYKNWKSLGGIKLGRLIRFKSDFIEEVQNGGLSGNKKEDVAL